MFGGKKKKILSEGTQARAVVLNVQDTGMTINDNPRVKLTLQVQPDGQVPFEVTKKQTVSRVSIPRVGDEYLVRYDPADPNNVEFDTAAIQQVNQAAEMNIAEAAAAQVPSDLAANGILGRGAKTPVGQLIDCAMTVGVRLIDGTAPYQTTCRVSLSAENAARLIPRQTLFTVRADPQDHSRVAISLSEPTPVVTVTDPQVVDPPARALREGVPCRVTIVAYGQQFLKLSSGEELYATKVRVDGSEQQIFLPVPANATFLLQEGKELPAKRILAEPNVMTVDWPAALAEAGPAGVIA